ncbi:MAG TPA: malto-oligosyltrehalose synthase [Streptosporangiaceae bacterium]|nr:malto-oligosyltrehalose synthase [Streptosporangiaceae bacterium]
MPDASRPDTPLPDTPVPGIPLPGRRPRPVSTYRLQLRPGFGFADAAAIADYLADLGVTHAYLSPILQAAPGSVHGYDVVDHSRVSAELGGEAAFRAMVTRFRRHGLGVIVDVVPNHMAVPVPESLNRQLWSVLRSGTASPYAHWFDVDWPAQAGRLLLPILAGPVEECLGDLILDTADTVDSAGNAADAAADAGTDSGADRGAEPVLRYFDHVLPVRHGTAGLPLGELLRAQHYRLACWRAAATELNWRRFFDVTGLIAVRVEYPGVFAATHGLLLRLMAEGLIDGLRVDHPDGLADPRGYLRQLAKATGGAWVVTEKILTGSEVLPPDWACAGTTGYDTLGAVGGLFVDPGGRAPLTETYARSTGGPGTFAGVALAAKRETATGGLAAELARLIRVLERTGAPPLPGGPWGVAHRAGTFAGLGAEDLRLVLTEILAAFPVYRAYVVPGEPPPPPSAAIVRRGAAAARGHLPERLHHALDTIGGLVLGGPAELVVRFQQTCGPLMAKGVEDTAYYRWSRLVALNEVGGEPDRFCVGQADFHAYAGRLARDWPATMTTLSTHDTKRQEDVRARLSVLAELPREWAVHVARWHDRAARLAGGRVPEPDTEYLMWQTLVGAWPIDRDRLAEYLRKAMREAKTRTSWADQDPGYESAVLAFADAVLRDKELTGGVAGFVELITPHARVNSLGAKLVQLTMPGVADVYQGCELTGLSLVDPDNRRPVDFARRRRMLAATTCWPGGATPRNPRPECWPGGTITPDSPPAGLDEEKLLVTSRALRLRRDHPDWFAGSYTPLRADGPAAAHAVAFLRGAGVVAVATRLPAGLRRIGGWADTALPLPAGRWRDVLTGAAHAGPRSPLAALAQRLPVALLVREGT